MIKLKDDEEIIAVVPELYKSGRFTNHLIWVHIVNRVNNKYRFEAIQLADAPYAIRALFDVCEAAHNAMLQEVKKLVE